MESIEYFVEVIGTLASVSPLQYKKRKNPYASVSHMEFVKPWISDRSKSLSLKGLLNTVKNVATFVENESVNNIWKDFVCRSTWITKHEVCTSWILLGAG